jgi:HD superfamily phosphohydrolase
MAKKAESTILPFPEKKGGGRSRAFAPSSKARRQELFLPVNGFVWFHPEEIRVINHPAFQRLAKINQLGQAHLVFPGATHKRMEHVLGAVGVAQRMISAVKLNSEKAEYEQRDVPPADQDWRASLSEAEERFIRLGALLHDIGHLAAGHTLEDELGLFGKHDEDERLDYVFGDSKKYGTPNWNCGVPIPTLSELIDRLYRQFLPDDLKLEISPSRLVRLLIRKPPREGTEGQYREEQKALAQSAQLRLEVCTNMIGNTICADLLDYIARDWYHVGRVYPPEDRIFQYMEVRNPNATAPDVARGSDARRHSSDKFVLALGSQVGRAPKIRTDGVSAILSLLERRYELGETVLYHKTKLSAGAMLGRALFELWQGEKDDFWRDLLDLSDEQLTDHALATARRNIDRANDQGLAGQALKVARQKAERAQAAERILLRLRSRHLYKAFYTERHWSITEDEKQNLTDLFAPYADDTGTGARNRAYAAQLLERTFELETGTVVVSCTNVRAKIAEVEVRINNKISQFNEFEEDHKRGLSGGHLGAQIERFDALWRLDFFMAPDTFAQMKSQHRAELDLMKDAIDQVFVRPPPGRPEMERAAGRIGDTYRRLRLSAAKSDPDSAGTSSGRQTGSYSPPSLATLWTDG